MADEEPELVEAWRLPEKLKHELEMALSGQLETSRELEYALDQLLSRRIPPWVKAAGGEKHERERRQAAVIQMWRRIADDEANIAEKEVWATAVAKMVVKYVLPLEAKERPRAALRALGFVGRLDGHVDLWQEICFYESFKDPEGAELSDTEFALLMQDRGYLTDKTVNQAMKTIARLREA